MTDAEYEIELLVARELALVADPNRRELLALALVPPSRISLGWNYGTANDRLDCWLVGRSPDGNVLLVYGDRGFGPSFPWGYVHPDDDSMGMDSQWHSGLEDAAIAAGLLVAPPGYEAPGPRQ